jgi:multicomponent Na+:H+ antiporter subunit E
MLLIFAAILQECAPAAATLRAVRNNVAPTRWRAVAAQRRGPMGRAFTLALALAAIWLLLSGHFDHPLLLAFGAASVLLCIFASSRAGALDEEGAPLHLMPRIFGYWLWLSGEIVKANATVLRQALAVSPKLSPKLVRVPVSARTNVGRVTFANSITLTPGTVSIDLDDDTILVHGLTEALADEGALADMGARVARIEGKDA